MESWRIDYVSDGVYHIVSMAAKSSDTTQNWNITAIEQDFDGYDLYYKITNVSTGTALTYYTNPLSFC